MVKDKGVDLESSPGVQKDGNQDTFPGNPNKQKQNSPGQQQGDDSATRDPSRLHEDRSVTDRTTRRSVLPPDKNDDGEIDRLKG